MTTADRFTYGGTTGNQPPTVAQPASATPNPVTGTTTTLRSSAPTTAARRTWATPGRQQRNPGRGPAFSANGTNAAKNTVVTFNRAGAYTFQVTITDSGGLTVASTVNVTVNQTFTSIVVSPSSVTLPNRGKQQFTAQALDQFSLALALAAEFHMVEAERPRIDQQDRPVHRTLERHGDGHHPGQGRRQDRQGDGHDRDCEFLCRASSIGDHSKRGPKSQGEVPHHDRLGTEKARGDSQYRHPVSFSTTILGLIDDP